jgi:hypothetical protein
MKNKSLNKNFNTEREGQLHFFKNFGIDLDENNILIANTDGVHNGNIFEFKLSINNTQQVLFQAIKYLSRLRITGNPVQKNILLVSLNQTKVYVFNSEDYFDEIHQIYYGGASRNNDGFSIKKDPLEIDYSTDIGADRVLKLLKENNFTKIKIDEDCIVGWAEKFYRENPTAKKSDFLDDKDGGEIRKPIKFKDYILPFKEKTNIKFKYLMDKLNDNLIKKELGAFFTPPAYAKKAVELVREAIKLVPKGNDYIILDRCAGTGNLQAELSDEELSHTIVSTYEYYEYKVLLERFNGRVRHIIPPTDDNVVFSAGFVVNADALSEDFINNEIIKQYIDNSKCTVILFENPPYSDVGAVKNNSATKDKKTTWKNSFTAEQMKVEITGTVKNDLANLFIWSGFKYYLRQKTDSYILFSPIKYWKSNKLVDKKFNNGFIFNRQHFHANASAISCIFWQNIDEKKEKLELAVYDIDTNNTKSISDDKIIFINKLIVKKVLGLLSKFYDKRSNKLDQVPAAICVWGGQEYQYKTQWNGKIFEYKNDKTLRIIPKYNKNIIGYLVSQDFGFEHPRLSTNLVRTGVYAGNGFYLREDNYLDKLPLFAAGKYPIEEKWYENGTIFKTSDGGDKYTKDKDFLKSCFIFTCLSRYNKCISFTGSDKRFYKNELCFDTKTLASEQIEKFKLNSDEKELLKIWQNILSEAKKTKNYDKELSYGPYQIEIELNTYKKDDNNKIIYDYPTLNGELENLKNKLKTYYAKYITQKLFQYELLK